MMAAPQQRISKYFSNISDDDDDDARSSSRTEVVEKALKREWWYDMFDVNQSQFDVSVSIAKPRISSLF